LPKERSHAGVGVRISYVEQVAASNAGWPFQFRFAVHGFWSRVPELWTLIWLREVNEETVLAFGFMDFSSPVSAGLIEQVQEPRAVIVFRWCIC
jgi:hypothetical protein